MPALATSWKASDERRTWTFNLRKGVKFHDGTPFNAAAVCANFNRWYNFTGALQNPSATYYYGSRLRRVQDVGTGVAARTKALYKSCKAVSRYTAVTST